MITVGQILLKHAIPDDMHHLLEKPLDAKGIRNLFATLADKHPDKYKDVVSKLTNHGFEASSRMGSSVSLEDLRSPIDKDKRFEDLQVIVDKIRKGEGTKAKKDGEETTAYMKFMDDMNKEVLDAGLKGNKTLAKIILSGSRGSPTQYRQTVAAPGIVPGPDGKPLLDFPLRKSFAEGLSPTEYLAHSFGTRTGLSGTKLAVADSGALSKVIFRSSMTVKIEEHDCGTHKGIPISTENKDYIGSFIAVPVGEFKHNNELTSSVLQKLKSEGIKEVIVRSPITCESNKNHHHGAVCQLCVGRRDKAHLLPIGDFVGVTAGTTLGEKMSQMTLGCLEENTGVRMWDGTIKSIKDVQIGDFVYGVSYNGIASKTKVINKFDQGIKPVFEWSFRRGKGQSVDTFIATENHDVLANTYKSECAEQSLNHVLRKLPLGYTAKHFRMTTPAGLDSNEGINEPFALLLGCLLGDGCYTGKTPGLRISCIDPIEIRDLNAEYNQQNIQVVKLPSHPKDHTVKHIVDEFCPNTGKQVNKVKQWMQSNGMYGKYAHEKELPPNIWKWSKDSVSKLIAGLYATAGSYYLSKQKSGSTLIHISISLTAEKLVRELRDILIFKLGIYSPSVTLCNKKDGMKQFRLVITDHVDVERFIATIPIIGVKRDKLQHFTSIKNNPTDPSRNDSFHKHPRVGKVFVGDRQCFDIEVAHPDNFFCLESGLVVSNSKHTGSTVKKQSLGGFKLVNQLFNIPETFRDKAPLAEEDGVVESVEKAGQGGFNIKIKHEKKTHEYYVPTGFEPKVKPQQRVEVGDVLSDGLVNPADVVRLQGVGEGRRHAAQQLKSAFDDAGLHVNSRNFDVITRNAIDHVRITDDEGLGDYLPNQVVSYNNLEKSYHARKDSKQVRVGDAKGMYLEAPALHYTIGTKLSSGMLENLKKHHFDALLVHDKAPGFVPEMQRLVDIPAHEDDWMHQLYSTYLQKRFIDAVNQGMRSDLRGASPIAGLAAGTIGTKRTTNFGEVKKELHTGVKVAATLINGDCELSNASQSAVDVTYANGNHTRRTWDGLSMIFKSAELIEKTAASKGCLMLMLSAHEAQEIAVWAKEHIADKHLASNGFEKEPHVTLMYGFLPDTDLKELEEFLVEQPLISVTLGEVSRFVCKNDGYDVIKIAVESDSLHELNAAVAKRFGKNISNDYPDYKPHLTLAYVKHGSCKGLDGSKHFKGKPYVFDSVLWSSANSKDRETFHFNTHKEELMLIDG